MKYSKKFLKDLYMTMVRIRLCEESLVGPIIAGEVRCPVHLYTGQEAIAAGVAAALSKKDRIFGTHRSHGHYLARGGKMRELIAEIYGKVSGCSKGRGGSMHLCDPGAGLLGTAPIVGGTISLALGCALAAKIRRQNNVTVSFFGDGAAGEGVLYESMNFAALYKLPLIFICENNFYSTHLPIKECRPDSKIFKIGASFCIPSFRADGNSVLDVYKTAKRAVDMCRRDKGPVFIEFTTYRLHGHVGPDDNIQGLHTDLRPREEIDRWKKKDPIKMFRKYILGKKILSKNTLEKIEKAAAKEVKEAHDFTKKSPYPGKNELADYVFKK